MSEDRSAAKASQKLMRLPRTSRGDLPQAPAVNQAFNERHAVRCNVTERMSVCCCRISVLVVFVRLSTYDDAVRNYCPPKSDVQWNVDDHFLVECQERELDAPQS